MSLTPNLLLFDFDGVIVDTYSFCFQIVLSREHGITDENYRQRFEGNIFDAVRKFKNPDTKVDDFTNHYTPELMKCEPMKEIAEAVKELAKTYTLVIISSSQTKSIGDYLEMVGLREYFTEILGCDVEKSKIKKINSSLQKYDIDPEHTLFITDTLGDMREADKCGVKSIGVVGGYHFKETLEKGNPIALVQSGEELVQSIDLHFRNI